MTAHPAFELTAASHVFASSVPVKLEGGVVNSHSAHSGAQSHANEKLGMVHTWSGMPSDLIMFIVVDTFNDVNFALLNVTN